MLEASEVSQIAQVPSFPVVNSIVSSGDHATKVSCAFPPTEESLDERTKRAQGKGVLGAEKVSRAVSGAVFIKSCREKKQEQKKHFFLFFLRLPL